MNTPVKVTCAGGTTVYLPKATFADVVRGIGHARRGGKRNVRLGEGLTKPLDNVLIVEQGEHVLDLRKGVGGDPLPRGTHSAKGCRSQFVHAPHGFSGGQHGRS